MSHDDRDDGRRYHGESAYASPDLIALLGFAGRPGLALDLGPSNTASDALRLAASGWSVVSVDLSRRRIGNARRRARDFRLPVRFVVGNAERLPFAAGVFQFAHDRLLVSNADDKRAYFSELARVMAPGALALIRARSRYVRFSPRQALRRVEKADRPDVGPPAAWRVIESYFSVVSGPTRVALSTEVPHEGPVWAVSLVLRRNSTRHERIEDSR